MDGAEEFSGIRGKTIDPVMLQQIARGARLAEVLPDVEAAVEKLSAAVFSKAFKGIDDGTLTPQQARDAWAELYASRKVLQKLEKLVKSAQAAGQDLREALQEDESNG